MYTLGIDIGSTTSKCALVEDGKKLAALSLVRAGIGTRGYDPALKEAFDKSGIEPSAIAATAVTGYGRLTYEAADFTASELTCHALGARLIFPGVRTVIDIGGQDAKVIQLGEDGKMLGFVMNDKCAAGTGRFLDVMANVLNIPVDQLENEAAASAEPAKISSTCTVFAESEVISRLSMGAGVPEVVAGICESVASRVAGLAKRMAIQDDVCMSGGVARNGAVRKALSEALGHGILYSENAQLFGAIGAAIYAYNKTEHEI